VLDSAGKVELVLYAALDLTRFGKIFDAQHLPQGSALNLTDHNGVVLYRYPRMETDGVIGMTDRTDLRNTMKGIQEEGVFNGVGLDGTRRQFAYKRLRLSTFGAPYLYLRISIPEQTVMAKTKRIIGISVAIFLTGAILTYFLTKIIAGRYLTHPIKQLVDASHAVERGNLAVRSCLPYSVDEIGQLARSFDAMTNSLDERLKEINLAESEKHRLAYYDPLTDLPNRRLLQDRLDLALVRSRRHGNSFALLYIDLDNFKHINDSLGHTAGDQLLKVMAARYLAALREDDIVCRLGGDEFAVILHDIQHDEDVTFVVEKLLVTSQTPLAFDGKELHVSASIGVALYPKDAEDVNTLEKNADLALYHAKDEGKNTFRMFSEKLNRTSHERITLTNALRHVLERTELTLQYQPKINLNNGKITGVEALLRWNSPEFGQVSPDRFIPLAEESRLIIPIGEWVLRTACAQQVVWRRQGLDLTIAVNLSAVQFKSPCLVESIKTILEETDILPEQLELELTESCLVNNPVETIKTLGKLRDLKCQIAIDDFGTGYSSLSYLKHFPVNILKIDRSFVKDLTHNFGDRAIAQSVVDLANNLNMVTVAEGVELSEQQTILKEIGCGYVQGFLYCRPVPSEQIPDIVQTLLSDRFQLWN
jgi:diguanylate cyclase (GGDEF)-like protein